MGACDFYKRAGGKTAKEAFDAAVRYAKHQHGHGGYSGTIAEKHSFTMITVPTGQEPVAYAQKLMQDGDRRIDDKWGPAGCIKLGEEDFFFFGWVSE